MLSNPAIYAPVFYNTVLVLVLLKCISLVTKSNFDENKIDKIDKIKAYLLCFAIIVFFGVRPISGRYFGDTNNYANFYERYLLTGEFIEKGEWLWTLIMTTCADFGLSVNGWFILIDFLYVGILIWASSRIKRDNIYLLILLFISAFGFFSGAVNGLRIGLATSIFILALTYIFSNRTAKVFAILLFFAAFSIHKSIILPVFCLLCSIFFFKNIFKNIRYPVYFWLLSVILLLLFGNFFISIIESLGLFSFDDRMAIYTSGEGISSKAVLDKGGFRWDFLLYSFLPIAFGWYITIKRKIEDRVYIILINTYTLANSFWILMMYANFSNRFVSLSWFLYPLLLVYPLIKFNLWENQNRKIALILFGNMFFTYFMWLIGR